MKYFWILLTTATLLSCERIHSFTASLLKKNNAQIDAIDLSKIDVYPLFKTCDPLQNFEEIKECFEQTVHQKIEKRIQNLKLSSSEFYQDTLFIKFSIENTGHFKYQGLQVSDSTKTYYPKLKAELQKIIHGLTPITPAKKQDVLVTTNYTLPLFIKTE